MKSAIDGADALPGQISRRVVAFIGQRRQPGADRMVPECFGKLAVTFRVVAEIGRVVHVMLRLCRQPRRIGLNDAAGDRFRSGLGQRRAAPRSNLAGKNGLEKSALEKSA
jgi:hypothetical protein